jgi:hypothetical protein
MSAASRGRSTDLRVALWVLAAVSVVIVLVVSFGPRQADNDPEPTTYNAGTQGTKAAYLLRSWATRPRGGMRRRPICAMWTRRIRR